MTNILIIDDEPDICDILRFNLEASGFSTSVAHSAESALQQSPQQFDLLLLDVMMPGMSGFRLAEHLRSQGITVPIIFLTARDGEQDTLRGFHIGADDYIAKPFSVREVVARVKAVLSRTKGSLPASPSVVRYGTLAINLADKTASADGADLALTRTEFELLHFLLVRSGQVFTRQQLLRQVWPPDVVVSERTVDVNITRLRKKLGPLGAHLISRQGYGYMFRP